ncbi:MAG: PEGA domain-containing protein [Moraxellaceae bacterium]|nr:PEGA domain-containing protein [Moraxellaceae bacterium]
MNKLIKCIFICSFLLISGCASIIDGKQQQMTFNSNPQGASVIFNGLPIGTTPVITNVQRSNMPVVIRFTKEGYKDYEVSASSGLNNWFWGNIISGGVYGSTTDYITGAMNKFEPGNYMVTLTPSEVKNLPGGTSQSDKQKIINFIVVGYSSIVMELNNKQGQYLSSLFVLATTPEAKKPEMVRKLKALSDVYTLIPEFAEKSAELLLANQ